MEESKANLEVGILQEEMENPILSREEVQFSLDKYRKMDLSKSAQRQRLIDGFVIALYYVVAYDYSGTTINVMDPCGGVFGNLGSTTLKTASSYTVCTN